jgi:hypothetical protein
LKLFVFLLEQRRIVYALPVVLETAQMDIFNSQVCQAVAQTFKSLVLIALKMLEIWML